MSPFAKTADFGYGTVADPTQCATGQVTRPCTLSEALTSQSVNTTCFVSFGRREGAQQRHVTNFPANPTVPRRG